MERESNKRRREFLLFYFTRLNSCLCLFLILSFRLILLMYVCYSACRMDSLIYFQMKHMCSKIILLLLSTRAVHLQLFYRQVVILALPYSGLCDKNASVINGYRDGLT